MADTQTAVTGDKDSGSDNPCSEWRLKPCARYRQKLPNLIRRSPVIVIRNSVNPSRNRRMLVVP
jgi:hypothetical protein